MAEIQIIYDGKYQHPAWSFEGAVERYGEEVGVRLIEAKIARLLSSDVTPDDYAAYIASPEWKLRASEAKRRAGQRCEEYLHASFYEYHHHYEWFERGEKLLWFIEDELETLAELKRRGKYPGIDAIGMPLPPGGQQD